MDNAARFFLVFREWTFRWIPAFVLLLLPFYTPLFCGYIFYRHLPYTPKKKAVIVSCLLLFLHSTVCNIRWSFQAEMKEYFFLCSFLWLAYY